MMRPSRRSMQRVRTILTATLLIGGCLMDMRPLWSASASQYRELGLQYRAQGQFSDAIAALRKAVELEPEQVSNYVILGWTLHLADQDREAAVVLQQSLERDPSHVPALNALGIVYLVNDDLAAAVLTHTWASILQPNNEIAHYNLSLAFQRLEYYDWAIDAAQIAAVLEPNNPHPLVALAIAHWGNGEQESAQQAYQQAIALDPRYRSHPFLNHLDQAGFHGEQIEAANQVLETMP